MGSIHERLKALHETALAEDRKRAELDALKKKKQKDELLEGERNQFPKLVTLKEKGILAMIADATDTKELKPEWPLSYEEKLEQSRQRTEAMLERIKKKPPEERSLRDILPHHEQEDKPYYWSVSILPPRVADNLDWDNHVQIVTIKQERRTRNLETQYEKVARVTIGFDGANLTIAGQDTSFVGPIPENEDEKTELLEEAFVRAFFNPEDVRVKPIVPYHRHGPELYA